MVARRDDKGRFVARKVVDRADNQRQAGICPVPTVDAVTAFSLMRAGTVVRRLDPNQAWAKFHRIQDGVVQTADTAATARPGHHAHDHGGARCCGWMPEHDHRFF